MTYNLHELVNKLYQNPSDINEHFPVIIKYGSECDHITEMGVRGIYSTWAWLSCNPKEGLYSYDLHNPSKWGGDLQSVIDTAKSYNIKSFRNCHIQIQTNTRRWEITTSKQTTKRN